MFHCISLFVNTLGKSMNPSLSYPQQWVNSRADWAFNLVGRQIDLGEGKILVSKTRGYRISISTPKKSTSMKQHNP